MRLAADQDWILSAPGDLERIEARFSGAAFAPHRHDTYAIGITLEGEQTFDYRGAARRSRPGGLVILHPDELHDGRAGDGGVFRYRTAYLPPADVQAVLAAAPLPFLEGGVSGDRRLRRAVLALLGDYRRPLSPLEQDDALYDLVAALRRLASGAPPVRAIDQAAAATARDYIEARLEHEVSLADLERATGRDRWRLSRDFRAIYGASPYRYLILRRLDRARRMMKDGQPIAGTAAACGFADQSHFGRLFRKAFGLTPRAWLRACGHDRSIPEARGRPN